VSKHPEYDKRIDAIIAAGSCQQCAAKDAELAALRAEVESLTLRRLDAEAQRDALRAEVERRLEDVPPANRCKTCWPKPAQEGP
jgi:hypothetical protein